MDCDSRLIDYADEYDYLVSGVYVADYINDRKELIKRDTGYEYINEGPIHPLWRVHTKKNNDGTYTHTITPERL